MERKLIGTLAIVLTAAVLCGFFYGRDSRPCRADDMPMAVFGDAGGWRDCFRALRMSFFFQLLQIDFHELSQAFYYVRFYLPAVFRNLPVERGRNGYEQRVDVYVKCVRNLRECLFACPCLAKFYVLDGLVRYFCLFRKVELGEMLRFSYPP